MTIDDLLIRARKMGASDVHVTVGIPPKCRVNGELVTLMEGRILPADSKALVEQMIPGRLVERFNREGEVDFSYAIKGVGRFRVNIFKQRGTMSFVIRLGIPKFQVRNHLVYRSPFWNWSRKSVV